MGGQTIGGSSVGRGPGSGSGSGIGLSTHETALDTTTGGAVTRLLMALRLNLGSSDSWKAENLYDLYFRIAYFPYRREEIFSIERTAPSRLRTAQHRSQVALAMARSASTAPRHDVTGATFPEQKHEEPLCDSRHSRGRGTRRTRPAFSQERLDRVPNERPLVLTRR